jgi:NitT/TauT family transport system substrate-binding protein
MKCSFRISTAAAGIAVASLIAGCGGRSAAPAGPGAPGSVEKPNLTLAALPAADAAGLYVAEQRGLFAAEGLHVKIVSVTSSATAIAGQEAGRYDVTTGNYVSYILAEAQDQASLRILAEGSVMQPRAQVILTPPGSRITDIADLKGKRIGVNVLGNIGTLLISSLLGDSGILPSQVHFVPIPFPEMTAALKAHAVDAAWLPEPFVSLAEQTIGAQQLADTDQGATENFPIAGYVVTRAWAKKYPRTAAAFDRALAQGQELADTDRTAVEQAMVSFIGVSKQTAAVTTIDDYPLSLDPARLQRIPDEMLRFGLLSQPFNVTLMTRGGLMLTAEA